MNKNTENFMEIVTKTKISTIKAATLVAMEQTQQAVMLPDEVVAYAIEFLAGKHGMPVAATFPQQSYEWTSDGRVLELPPGTSLLFPYKKVDPTAVVDNDGKLKHEGESITPGELVRRYAGTPRNARASLLIKRPGDDDYVPAKELFKTAEKSRLKPVQDDHEDILYKDFIVALDKLKGLGEWTQNAFRRIHQTGSSLDGMRKYASVGIDAGNEKARCKFDSRNGRVYRRVVKLLEQGHSEMTEKEVDLLVESAIKEVPFLD